jgi:hypothetical protein
MKFDNLSSKLPKRLPDQCWFPTPEYPYPMNFVQYPSRDHQLAVRYHGKDMLQGLSIIHGPLMYHNHYYPCEMNVRAYAFGPYRGEEYSPAYPTTHSIPGPYLQKYIYLQGLEDQKLRIWNNY